MKSPSELTSDIVEVSIHIENYRMLKSKLLEQRCKAVFEKVGMKHGDDIYKKDDCYSFDLNQSTVQTESNNILWVSIYGHRNNSKSIMIGYCPESDVEKFFLPEGMRK